MPNLKPSLEAATEISLAEALHVHQAAGYFPSRAADYGAEVRQRIESGAKVLAHRYLAGFDLRKRLVHQPMALDSALPSERIRHDMEPEMRFAARPVPGMAGVLVGLIHHIKQRRGEGHRQLQGRGQGPASYAQRLSGTGS